MKNRLLIFFTAMLLATLAQAQISIGFRAGTNLANVAASDSADLGADDTKYRAGLQFGALVEIGITDKFAVQIEPSFMQKGYGFKVDEEFLGQSFKINGKVIFNYIDVPVLAKLRFSGENTGFYAFAGPSFGYLNSGKYKATTEIGGQKETEEEDLEFDDEDGINRVDVSAVLGAGFQINMGGGRFFADVRYNMGLSDLDDSEEDFSIRNRGIGIGVGYLYSF